MFAIPIKYSGQDFDEKQHRAQVLTDEDRAAGRPAPEFGYSDSAWKRVEEEYRKAQINYWGACHPYGCGLVCGHTY